MRNSELSGLHSFELKIGQVQKAKLRVHEKPILKVIFVTLTDNSSVKRKCIQRPQKYPHNWK